MTILLAAALLIADPAVVAQQPDGGAPVAAAPTQEKLAEKKICKHLDGDTGTHLSRRVCKTADEWTAYNRGGGSSADDLKAMGAH